MTYTVKQLSRLAGISPRTLHYYDEIGLLKPGCIGQNGYRYYNHANLLLLQQILFFRELGFSLAEIKTLINRPGFDLIQALEAHQQNLQLRAEHLQRLIETVSHTILHLKGNMEMKPQKYFEPFSEEKQKAYAEQIRQKYGEKQLMESQKNWGSYTDAQKQNILAESDQIYADIIAHMDKSFDSPEVQQLIARWHQHMRYFYEPDVQILRGLADMYNEDPEFQATFANMHPGLAAFMRPAVHFYCDQLEKTA